jgi:hypothetical protein
VRRCSTVLPLFFGLGLVAAGFGTTRHAAHGIEDSGYLACKNVPTSIVRAANHSRAGLTRLARMVGEMLMMAFPKDQLTPAAIGCARALRQKGLEPRLPPPAGSHA